jgi:site-specific DNA-methyltransferase (cytosine-N4-specific)
LGVKERFLLNSAWEPIYWFSNSPLRLHSDNRRILREHTDRHMALIMAGGEKRARSASDGAYTIRQAAMGWRQKGRFSATC